MAGVNQMQFALRNDAMVFIRCFYGYEHVVGAMQNKHGTCIVLQDGAQGSLIGVEEVAGIGNIEHRFVQHPHMRQCLAQQGQARQLQPVQHVVEMVVAQQFKLLYPDSSQHR